MGRKKNSPISSKVLQAEQNHNYWETLIGSNVETLTLGTIDVFFWWRAMTRYRRQHIRVAFIRSKLHQFENFMSFFSIHELTTLKVMNTDGQHSFHPCFNDYKVLIEGKGERMSDTIHQDRRLRERGIEAIHTIQYLTYLFLYLCN